MKIIHSENTRDNANLILQALVAASIIGLIVYVIWLVSQKKLPADSVIVGSMLSIFGILVGFCFPNSIGSSKAQDTINKLADKTPPVTGDAKESLDDQRREAATDRVLDSRSTSSIRPAEVAPDGPLLGPAQREELGLGAENLSGSDVGLPAEPPAVDGLGEKV